VKDKVKLETVNYDYANGTTTLIAQGYEQLHTCTFTHDSQESRWEERRLVVYSIAYAEAQRTALQARIDQTQSDLKTLNQPSRGKKPFSDLDSFVKAVEQIISKHRVQSLFQLTFQEQVEQHPQRRYRDRAPRVIEKRRFQVDFALDLSAVERQMQVLGWRVYATNQPQSELSLSDAVIPYRQEYLIERGFGRLKGELLCLRPMFLQREDHIKGLIRLLTIGLRLLTLVEFQVRRALDREQSQIAGVYMGNPKRSTAQPTAEILLASFKEITLVLIEGTGEIYADLTVLNPLQQRILQLMDFSLEIYTCLGPQSDDPP